MAPLSIQIYVVGPVQTNCYFAINDDTKEVLIIDPGASAKQLAEKVKEQELKPVAIRSEERRVGKECRTRGAG